MSFCSLSKDTLNSNKTIIDNLFFTNYMPDASADSVKVYLYGLYLCQINEDVSITDMANTLSLSVAEIKDYFKYWEEYGVLNIVSCEPFVVSYNKITDNTAKYKKFKPEKYSDFSKAAQLLITDRMISTSEYTEYYQLMENTPLRPEALLMIIKYCIDLKGGNLTYKYIITVAKDFVSRGITTFDLVSKELSNYFTSTKEVSEIFRELKSNKKPEIEEIKTYQKWVSNYGFEHEFILSIIPLSKCKTFKKLDVYIEELFSNKCFTLEEAKIFFKNKENLIKLSTEINKTLGIYIEVLDNVVTTYTSPWVSMGYDSDTLLFIANYCFKKNKRTLELMNETIKNLYKLGLITLESIYKYIKARTETDNFISKMLEYAGISRKPNNWDRENVENWRNWNFSDEIILEAAKLSSGVNNPIPYINGILSNWKSKNAFTLQEVKKLSENKPLKDGKSTHFENERKYTKEELNSLIDSFDDFKV